MSSIPAGTGGAATSLGILGLVWLTVAVSTAKYNAFEFDAQGERGAFEKLLPVYLRVAEVVIGLDAGSIVLLVGSSALHVSGRLPWIFMSPLFLLAFSIFYGILFMVFLITDYEEYRHHPGTGSYTRFKFTRNRPLGYSGLFCFCTGYAWLILVVPK
jgi:uncharacterized membrane protein